VWRLLRTRQWAHRFWWRRCQGTLQSGCPWRPRFQKRRFSSSWRMLSVWASSHLKVTFWPARSTPYLFSRVMAISSLTSSKSCAFFDCFFAHGDFFLGSQRCLLRFHLLRTQQWVHCFLWLCFQGKPQSCFLCLPRT